MTIYIDLTESVLQQEHNWIWYNLAGTGFYGQDPVCQNLYLGCVSQPMQWSIILSWLSASLAPDQVVYGFGAAVPEPATWALLLFGFAFFALKGIWPKWTRS